METRYIVVGGYVYSRAINNFTTYNALSAIDLPTLVDWVKGTDETLHTNTIVQVAGEESPDGSYDGGFFSGDWRRLGKNRRPLSTGFWTEV